MKKFILVLLITFLSACSTQETNDNGKNPISLTPEDKEFIQNLQGRSLFGQNTVEVDNMGNISQTINGETKITHYFYKSSSDNQAVYTLNEQTRNSSYIGIDFEDDYFGERKINEYGKNQSWNTPNKVGWSLDDKTFMPDALDLEFIEANTKTYSFGGKNYRIEQNTGHIYDNVGKIIYYFVEAKDETHAIYAQSEGEYIGVLIENNKFHVYKEQGNSFWRNIYEVDWELSNKVNEKDLIFIFEAQGSVDFGSKKYSIRRDGNIYNRVGELIYYFIKVNPDNSTQAVYSEGEYAYIGIQLENKKLKIFQDQGKYPWGTENQVSWDSANEYIDTSAQYIPNAVGGYTFLGADYRIKSDGHIYNDVNQIVYRFIEAEDSSTAMYAQNSGEYLGVKIASTGSAKTFNMYKKNRLQFWSRAADVSFQKYHELLTAVPGFISQHKGSHIFDDNMAVIADNSTLSIDNTQYIFVEQKNAAQAVYKTADSDREFFGAAVNNQTLILYKQNKNTYWIDPSLVTFTDSHKVQERSLTGQDKTYNDALRSANIVYGKHDTVVSALGSIFVDGQKKYTLQRFISQHKALYKDNNNNIHGVEYITETSGNKVAIFFNETFQSLGHNPLTTLGESFSNQYNRQSFYIDGNTVTIEFTHSTVSIQSSYGQSIYNILGFRSEEQVFAKSTSSSGFIGLDFSQQSVTMFADSSKQPADSLQDIVWDNSGKMKLWNVIDASFYTLDYPINSYLVDKQNYKILDMETEEDQNTLYYIVNQQKELIGEHKGYTMSDSGVLYFVTVNNNNKYVINIKDNYSSVINPIQTDLSYNNSYIIKLKIYNNNLYILPTDPTAYRTPSSNYPIIKYNITTREQTRILLPNFQLVYYDFDLVEYNNTLYFAAMRGYQDFLFYKLNNTEWETINISLNGSYQQNHHMVVINNNIYLFLTRFNGKFDIYSYNGVSNSFNYETSTQDLFNTTGITSLFFNDTEVYGDGGNRIYKYDFTTASVFKEGVPGHGINGWGNRYAVKFTEDNLLYLSKTGNNLSLLSLPTN